MTKTYTKWVPAHEYYETGRDPLRGKKFEMRAEQGNAVRDELVKIMPTTEIAAALGGDDPVKRVMANTGKPEVVRVRADFIGFLKALRLRYQHNTGEDISLPNIVSMVALHGAAHIVKLPAFTKVT